MLSSIKAAAVLSWNWTMATEIEHDTVWTFTATCHCQTQNRTSNLSRTQGIKIFARQCIQDRAMQRHRKRECFRFVVSGYYKSMATLVVANLCLHSLLVSSTVWSHAVDALSPSTVQLQIVICLQELGRGKFYFWSQCRVTGSKKNELNSHSLTSVQAQLHCSI